MSALDLAEPQALIHTPDSADGDWLHVVLLRRVKDAEWICLQPDATLATRNPATHRVTALLRRAPFPEAVRGYVVEFLAGPNEGGEPMAVPASLWPDRACPGVLAILPASTSAS